MSSDSESRDASCFSSSDPDDDAYSFRCDCGDWISCATRRAGGQNELLEGHAHCGRCGRTYTVTISYAE